MADERSVLETFYDGWEAYQGHLAKAIAPLTSEQLELSAGSNLRSIRMLATHIVAVRARWFHGALGQGGPEIAAIAGWDREGAAARTAAELVEGLDATWRLMRDALAGWSPEDLQQTVTREWRGREHSLLRAWVVWHVIEHDLHHGGELSFSLGMHGLAALDI